MKTKLKKFFVIVILALTFSTFIPSAQAGIWQEESMSFCLITAFTPEGPIYLLGSKDNCVPNWNSWCTPRRCELLGGGGDEM